MNQAYSSVKTDVVYGVFLIAFILFLLCFIPDSFAGSREQAKMLHDRLVGVPASVTTLESMASNIAAGNFGGAAMEAMQNPAFYNTTIKNMVTPWTNISQSVFDSLNDYSATVIGMIRDDIPFNQVLTEDIIYIGSINLGLTAYSHTDNIHYQQLEDRRIDLSNPANLVRATQSSLPGTPLSNSGDTAGVLTTRAAALAFLQGGTNRRMVEFTFVNHMCKSLEEINDTTRPTDRIRQDVTRSPGGDSAIFLNSCSGCHAGMDPLSQAFAYYNFPSAGEQRLQFTPGLVQGKNLINANAFQNGFITQNDHWDNYWRVGPNSNLGWSGVATGGNGPKSFGAEIANSRSFSTCQVKKVFNTVCFRAPSSLADRIEVERIADVFVSNSYNMKRVFAEAAGYCVTQ